MIRRRSYAEAMNGSNSSEDEERNVVELRTKEAAGSFVRSDSLQYYDMRQSRKDVSSTHSAQEVYDICLEYVEKRQSQARLSALDPTLQSFLKDVEETVNVAVVELDLLQDTQDQQQEERQVLVENGPQNFNAIETYEDFYEESRENNSTINAQSSVFPITYSGRNSTRKKRKNPEFSGKRSRKPKRVVFKQGGTNIPLRNNIEGRKKLFFDDYVTTMIEWRWRWVFLLFSASNFLVWGLFALMFYVAAYANGDLEDGADNTPCIAEGRTFTGIFTFSVETQVVVGYIMIGALVCVVYAKIARPEKHLSGVGFSKKAVVCMRDGKLCLVFRAWDCLEKHAIGCQLQGRFIKHTVGSGPCTYPLKLSNCPLIFLPMTVEHVIDEGSPLYDYSAKDLMEKRFEIIITLTGADRETGQMTQSRTSYMPHEILWGSRFKTTISYNQDYHAYVIDKKSVNTVEAVDIPLCSARWLKHVDNTLHNRPTSLSLPSSPLYLSPSTSPFSSPQWSFRNRKLNESADLEIL